MNGFSNEDAGFAVMTWTAAPAIMSCFLPSPSTAYDKASGAITAGAESVATLRRDEIIGATIALAVAAGASLLVSARVGARAAWVFVGAVVILGVYLLEFERALRKGKAEASS